MSIITVWINEAEGHFFGYRPEHAPALRRAFQYGTSADTVDLALAESFDLLNIGDDPMYGDPDQRAVTYRLLGNRSLSVGDVISVDGDSFAVEAVGWSRTELTARVP